MLSGSPSLVRFGTLTTSLKFVPSGSMTKGRLEPAPIADPDPPFGNKVETLIWSVLFPSETLFHASHFTVINALYLMQPI